MASLPPDTASNLFALELAKWTSIASMTAALVLFACAVRLYRQSMGSHRGRGFGTLLQLLSVQAILDIGTASWGLMGHPTPGSALCVAQAVLSSFFPMAEMLWVCCIAYYMKWICCTQFASAEDYVERMNALWVRFFGATLGISTLATALPALWNVYGDDTVWCWMHDTPDGEKWMFIQFYGPFVLVVIVCSIWCCQAAAGWKVFVDSHPHASSLRHAETKLMTRLRMMPALLILCYSIPCANRIQHTITVHNNPDLSPPSVYFQRELLYASAIAFSLGGIINALLYVDVVIVRAVCLPPQLNERGRGGGGGSGNASGNMAVFRDEEARLIPGDRSSAGGRR